MRNEEVSIEAIIEIYYQAEFTPSIFPKQELSNLFYDINGHYIIWSYGFTRAFKEAYNENRDALRKALIALLKRSISYFNGQISKHPSLRDEYEQNISKNKTLMANINSFGRLCLAISNVVL